MLLVLPAARDAGADRSITRTYSVIGRIGSCVPRQFMSVEVAPHCWDATSFADPEYVIDLTSPSAFCAFAMTVFASCAAALAATDDRHTAIRASFLTGILLITNCGLYSGTAIQGITIGVKSLERQ